MTTALLLGATGLVGAEALKILLGDPSFTKVVTLTRRPLEVPLSSPTLDARVVNFDRLEEHADAFRVDSVICALGTTIRVAGSQERFRRVDYEYPMTAARLGLAAGARHYLLITALGASADSRIFYNRVKGELERDVTALGYPRLTILRPSMLIGDRKEKRLGEELSKPLMYLIPGNLRAVRARDVATVLVHEAPQQLPGRLVIESGQIRAIARSASTS